MTLSRIEYNVSTHELIVIAQVAYRNSDLEVLVLDVGELAPNGYEAFDPTEDEVAEITE